MAFRVIIINFWACEGFIKNGRDILDNLLNITNLEFECRDTSSLVVINQELKDSQCQVFSRISYTNDIDVPEELNRLLNFCQTLNGPKRSCLRIETTCRSNINYTEFVDGFYKQFVDVSLYRR